ncbi:MAG TPA: divergent polysaccharide deacetylase family protein [Methylomirabilota bacterium]|nr:divergent polysaccharide deacetylase family protein [Methylomirabilota bacterium]
MPARVWQALAGLIVLLLVAVVGLDQWQVRRGEPSLFGFAWSVRRAPEPSRPPRPAPPAEPPAAPAVGGRRVAVIVDGLGQRREAFDLLRELRRPLAVAVLPRQPLSQAIAREAGRSGMEVLLALPMEPYRYPEVNPGPGALLMSMKPEQIQRLVGEHLEALPVAVGLVPWMGSRMSEDRVRMRAVLEVLQARRLIFVDDYASSLSVAYDEARELGVRAVRRQVLVDGARGEAGDRARWDEVGGWAERRGEVVVIAHGQAATVRLLREYVPRWEARGIRLVPVSSLAR